MTAPLLKIQLKREIDKLLASGLRPLEIQKQLKMTRTTYYNYVRELQQEMYSEDAMAQHDKEINSNWERLERILLIDLNKTKDDPIDRAKIVNNAIKLNKERLDYLLKTGKLKEEPKELNINSNSIVLTEIDLIQKYLNKKDGDLNNKNVKLDN